MLCTVLSASACATLFKTGSAVSLCCVACISMSWPMVLVLFVITGAPGCPPRAAVAVKHCVTDAPSEETAPATHPALTLPHQHTFSCQPLCRCSQHKKFNTHAHPKVVTHLSGQQFVPWPSAAHLATTQHTAVATNKMLLSRTGQLSRPASCLHAR